MITLDACVLLLFSWGTAFLPRSLTVTFRQGSGLFLLSPGAQLRQCPDPLPCQVHTDLVRSRDWHRLLGRNPLPSHLPISRAGVFLDVSTQPGQPFHSQLFPPQHP